MILLLTFTVNRDTIVHVKSKQQPREGRKDHTMKTYEITYSNGNGIYSANLVIAESAEQATAYYTAEGREVIGCTETMSRPKPGQPVVTVPEGWTVPAAETETETAPAAEPETETVETETAETETTPAAETETVETTEGVEADVIIACMAWIIAATPAHSAWARGVRAYAAELCNNLRGAAAYAAETGAPSPLTDRETVRAALLNGARDWSEYSRGGCALIYDGDIAARVCTPSELRRTHGGRRDPNPRETWLDVQARALCQAGAVVLAAYDKTVRKGARA